MQRPARLKAGASGTYLFSGDHDTNLLNCFGELFGFNAAVVVKIEVLKALNEHILLALVARSLLRQLLEKLFFKTKLTSGSAKPGETA